MSENLEHNNLLARWLNGELSAEEEQELKKTAGLDELKAVIEDIDTWKLPSVDIESKLSEVKKHSKIQEKETTVRTLTFRPLLRIAAAIALLAVAYFIVDQTINPRMISIETGLAQQITHDLPDGSKVTLGPNSKLEYRKKDWSQSRNLELVGQGFFDVEKGSTFIVSSLLGEITVLGTEFDVYNRGSKLLVNCFEGSVRVSADGRSEILNALEGVVFSNRSVTRLRLEGSKPAWTSGISDFSNAPLSEVVEELKRYYSIDIELSSANRNKEYSGSFKHNDLNAALRSVFAPLEISYTLSADGKVVFN